MVIIRKPVKRSENIVDLRELGAKGLLRGGRVGGKEWAKPFVQPKAKAVDEAMLREMMSQVNQQLGRIRRSRMR